MSKLTVSQEQLERLVEAAADGVVATLTASPAPDWMAILHVFYFDFLEPTLGPQQVLLAFPDGFSSQDDLRQQLVATGQQLAANRIPLVAAILINECWTAQYARAEVDAPDLIRPADRPDRTECIALAGMSFSTKDGQPALASAAAMIHLRRDADNNLALARRLPVSHEAQMPTVTVLFKAWLEAVAAGVGLGQPNESPATNPETPREQP